MRLSPRQVHRCKMSVNRMVGAAQSVGLGTGNKMLCRCKGRCVMHKMLSASGTSRLKGTMMGDVGAMPMLLRSVTSMTVKTGTPGLNATSRQKGPTMLLAIAGRPSADALRLASGLRTSLGSLRGGLPTSMGISASVFHRDHFVRDSVKGIGGSLLRKNVFIIVILFLFLTGMQAAVVSLMALPVSLVISVLALRCVKVAVGAVDLNNVTVTVNSLISSTVMSMRGMCGQLHRGQVGSRARHLPMLSIMFGTSGRMHVPVLGSALVVMIDFMPLFFLANVRKHVLMPLNITFVITLFTSAVITLAIAPMLYSCLLNEGGDSGVPGRTFMTH